jgi:hypothetical protein
MSSLAFSLLAFLHRRPHLLGPLHRRRFGREQCVIEQQLAALEVLRFPAVGLPVERQLAAKQFVIVVAHEFKQQLARLWLPRRRRRTVRFESIRIVGHRRRLSYTRRRRTSVVGQSLLLAFGGQGLALNSAMLVVTE